MLTTKQVAERLKTNDDKVRHWCSTGHLPNARKLGRDWVIPERDIKDFIPPKEAGEKFLKKVKQNLLFTLKILAIGYNSFIKYQEVWSFYE